MGWERTEDGEWMRPRAQGSVVSLRNQPFWTGQLLVLVLVCGFRGPLEAPVF